MQPLAVSLANYLTNVAGRASQPVRRDPRRRRACWPHPPSRCSSSFQRHFTSSDIGSGVKG